jgi:hypothetical protein
LSKSAFEARKAGFSGSPKRIFSAESVPLYSFCGYRNVPWPDRLAWLCLNVGLLLNQENNSVGFRLEKAISDETCSGAI